MGDTIIDKYKEYIVEEKHVTKNTLDAYMTDVYIFMEYLKENEVENIDEINKTTIIKYLMDLKEKGKASSTISRNLASVRSFFQYLLNTRLVKEDPTLNLKSPKIEKKIPEILTIEEVEKLLSMPNVESSKGLRDKAMLELLYATGIKVTELISIDMENINLNIGMLSVKDTEDNLRVVPVGRIALKYLKEYFEKYRADMEIDEEALFLNHSKNRLTRQGFWKILKQYAKESDIEKTVTPNTLRHSFAVHLINNGADLRNVQEILGHSDLSTTQVYAFASKDMGINEMYNKTHPRA